MYFIIITEKESELEITIIKDKIITLSIKKKEKKDDINTFANALETVLDFFDNCEVNVFSSNIFVTNTLNEWMDAVSNKHESWRRMVEKQKEKNVIYKGFTAYSKLL